MKILLGNLRTAQAIDPNTNKVVYEVIYLDVADRMENADGVPQSNSLDLSDSINSPLFINDTDITCDDITITCGPNDFQITFSNAFDNMRTVLSTKITHTLAQPQSLPLWMTSVQKNGVI